MPFVNISGELIDTSKVSIRSENIAWNKGSCYFETIRAKNYKPLFLDDHFERLWKGIQFSGFPVTPEFTREYLHTSIITMLELNKHENARIRLRVSYSEQDGLHYTITSVPLTIQSKQPLDICIYPDSIKNIDSFSNFKTCDRRIYEEAMIKAQSSDYNDAIILNLHHRICDSTIANVFLVKDKILYTPSISEGCIAGVYRKNLLLQFSRIDVAIIEKEITINELMEADEVFLTNCIRNIMPVKRIDKQNYDSSFTYSILENLPEEMK